MRHGNANILMAFTIAALSAFGAMAVDVGISRMAHDELKNAMDAGSHAGSAMLDGTSAGMTRARQAAAQYANLNPILGSAPGYNTTTGANAEGAVELGYWKNGKFIQDESSAKNASAVRVRLKRPTVPTFLGKMAWGTDVLQVSDRSTGRGGGLGAAGCPLPIAVPSCRLTNMPSQCSLDVVFGPDNNDNGAWALIGSSRPNASTVRDAIQSCTAASNVDDVVTLNNGQITSAAKTLADTVAAASTTWNTKWGTEPAQSSRSGIAKTKYGRVLNGQIIVFEDPSNCASTKYNGSSLDLVGFLSVAVYDVDTSGAAAQRTIRMHAFCQTISGEGGGGWYGTRVKPSLVE